MISGRGKGGEGGVKVYRVYRSVGVGRGGGDSGF